MTDLATRFVSDGQFFHADLAVGAGELAADGGLRTAIIISLFTDARARADDVPPGGAGDRRGWWGDAWPSRRYDGAPRPLGSRLWLLHREKRAEDTRARAEGYAREALAWLIEDGIAERVEVSAQWLDDGRDVLALGVTVHRPAAPPERYRELWSLA